MMAQKYPWKSFEEAKLKKKKMDVILNTAFIVEPQKTKCFELGKCLSAAKKIFEKSLMSSKASKASILETIPEESIILRSKGAMAGDNKWKRCDTACLFDPKKLEIPQVVQKPMNEKDLFVRWFALRGCGNEGTADVTADYWDKSRHQNYDFLFWTWKLKAIILQNTHEDQLKQGFIFLDISDHSARLPEFSLAPKVVLTPKLPEFPSFWYVEDSMIKDKSCLLDLENPKKPQLVKQPVDEKELYVKYSMETEKCYGTTRERAESRWEERKNVKNGLLYVTWKMHAVKLRLEHENQIRKKWIVVKS
ncbi:hypothetical protein B9Z55_007411 [Caenorhabditis nigoni]|uniref:Uncharacterized protein n=1 Tax=Caenorhabditis nigoni TaxID=1611254 RepID=A0A2G5VA81_9PELO|nr:hypothetical protein B9Z55_007411 [Caenorhabditis nigoni]